MRIQHNIMAMNAYRNYTNNVSAMKKNLEKLSSGYKINRAGDDAAGLAISEKMRAQITGLKQAQSNAKSGINLVQTAEGALTEVHDMLNRMFKLAEQSANGTYDDDVDRNQLQKEVSQLKEEINRIADSSNFNGIKLLDGSLDGSSSKTEITGMKDIAWTGTPSDATVDKVEAQAGRWEVDLSNIKFTSVSGKDTALAITIGGVTVGTITIAGTVNGKADEVVTMFNEDTFKLADDMDDVLIDGVSCSVRFEDGKLIVEMAKAPTTTAGTTDGIPGDMTLTFGTALPKSVTWNLSDGTTLVAGQNDIQMTQTQEARVAGDERLLANAAFTLTTDMVKDGNSIKIGDEVYTFAVGKDSKFKGGDKVIDLTAYEKDDIVDTGRAKGKIDISEIAGKLSEVAKGNKQWNVGTNGKDGVITLTERPDSGLNYKGSQIVGPDGTKGNLTDGKWKGIVQQGQASVQQSKGGLILQIGDTAEDFNQLSVSVGDMHTKAMGIGDVDISKQGSAQAAMDAIKKAINYVSDARGTLGATQNRLDHTINNLSVMEENIQDAESTIRDTDVADEMMAYTKNNILIQSAQAMLAQANQVPQGVLQLLQ